MQELTRLHDEREPWKVQTWEAAVLLREEET